MILSDSYIKKEIQSKNIIVRPKPNFDVQLSACSLDLHLGGEFRVFQYSVTPYIDIKKAVPANLTRRVRLKDTEPFIIQPGEFVIASTKEWIELADNIAGRLEGRSSLARIGIITHATAALFSPGWRGTPVLELGNIARIPVALYPGMRICAFTFEYVSSLVENPYYKSKTAKYKGQKGAVASKIEKESM